MIDDDGRGYADHGEEEDWKVRMEESEEEQVGHHNTSNDHNYACEQARDQGEV